MSVKNKSLRPIVYLVQTLVFFCPSLGAVTYDGSDISGIEELIEEHANNAKWTGKMAWRNTAQQRIDRYRKKQSTIILEDAFGNPISGAMIDAKLVRHEFQFGTVFGVKQFNMIRKHLHLFGNQIGFENALKYKHKDTLSKNVPEVLAWARENAVTVRGHTLVWPGWRHMHKDALHFKNTPDIKGLQQFVDNQIIEASQKWDVVAWDVLNEPLGNQDIQKVLGQEVMAQWFSLAARHRRNDYSTLYINENRIISAPTQQQDRIQRYINTIRSILQDGGPIEGIGVQARFRTNDISPAMIYRRLERLAIFKLPIMATEFEVVDTGPHFSPSEYRRAEMTENYMTILFSHPRVTGIVAWTLLNKLTKKSRAGEKLINIPDNRGLLNWDLSLPLNGKVWLHLINQRWQTHATMQTNKLGAAKFLGFKGYYVMTISKSSQTEKRLIKVDDNRDEIILRI
jgi:endo-1,4-beta-xylanase